MSENLSNQKEEARLVGRDVLLLNKSKHEIVEVTVVEITQHKYRVKLIGALRNQAVIGVRKTHAVLFPLKTSVKKELQSVVKKMLKADDALSDFIDLYACANSKG